MRRAPPGAPAIVFRSTATSRETAHTSRVAIPALLYGIRYWLRDEIALVDEYSNVRLDRTTLFAVAGPATSQAGQTRKVLEAIHFLLSLRAQGEDGEWTTVSVSNMIIDYCQKHRQPRSVLFRAFDHLREQWPGHTILSPTPLGLATLAATSRQQQDMALRRYYKPPSGPYVSHIRLHHDITADRTKSMTRRQDGSPPRTSSDAVTVIKARAERIYNRVPDGFKQKHKGDFMAIVVTADEYFTAAEAHKAVETARSAHPHGLIHLVRIGHDATFSHPERRPAHREDHQTDQQVDKTVGERKCNCF